MSMRGQVIAMLLALLLASLFLVGSLRVNEAEYDRHMAALTQVAELNGVLDNAVLSIQSLAEDDYDRITEAGNRLLTVVPVLSARTDTESILRSIRIKIALIERFKSQHSMFLNSFRAIPELEDELRTTPKYREVAQTIDGPLSELQWSMFRDVFVPNDSAGSLTADALARLTERDDFRMVEQTTEWQLLIAHIQKLISTKPERDEILEAIRSESLLQFARPLQLAVGAEYEARVEHSKLFQMGLFGLSIILLLLAAQLALTIWRHKQSLEDRVAQRTTELEDLNLTLKEEMRTKEAMQKELAQAQKLEAVGQLSAGIAHEINTPTQYVGDNIRFLQESFEDVLSVTTKLTSDAKKEGGAFAEKTSEYLSDVDLDFLCEEIPRAISESAEGIERVTDIVRALKEFSHPSKEMVPENLNRAIESTVIVARNEWKYVADLDLDLDPELPPIPVVLSEFNQVLLNLIVNASHAVADVVGNSGNKGTIGISTRLVGSMAEIEITDTGSGIPQEIVDRIFEPFFTTKEVGRGTGQGLAIAHNVIVEKHGGSLSVSSEPNLGSRFVIQLPLSQPERQTAAVA